MTSAEICVTLGDKAGVIRAYTATLSLIPSFGA